MLSHCRFLEPSSCVITGHPFLIPSWTGSLRRYGDQPPSDVGCLVPPLLVAWYLLSCCLYLCFFPGPDKNAHTHINKGDTSIHVYTLTGLIQRHKHKQGTQVFQELKMPMSSSVGNGVRRHHVLPLELPVHLLPENFHFLKVD